MKERLTKNWNLWRIARTVFAVTFMIAGLTTADYILFSGGLFLLVHALWNSCAVCVGDTCALPQNSAGSTKKSEQR